MSHRTGGEMRYAECAVEFAGPFLLRTLVQFCVSRQLLRDQKDKGRLLAACVRWPWLTTERAHV